MLLGKRPRRPLKRTTSMSDVMFDLNVEASAPSDPHQNNTRQYPVGGDPQRNTDQDGILGLVSPTTTTINTYYNKNGHKYGANFVETAHFLRTCGLCKRRLVPGRDIYMYRGDTAFCSLECRQQQMNQDERKEKCSLLASKKEASTTSSTKSESTVAAL